jgi:hypothetical protein
VVELRYNPKYQIDEVEPFACPGADIWIHDTEIHRAIKFERDKSFLLEVMYPVDWDEGSYEPKQLIFHNVSLVAFKFGNVAGCPAILDMTETVKSDSKYEITLGTTHGNCVIECSSIELSDGWLSTLDSDLKFDLVFLENEK